MSKKPAAKKAAPSKSSKKKPDAAPPKRAAAPKLGSAGFECPAEADVVTLVRRLKGVAHAASEKAGEVGEMIAKACETKHFDRKALSMVRGLESMSDNKLQVTLPHLLMYIDALELGSRAERQGQLIADEKAAKANGKKNGKANGDEAGDEGTAAPALQAMPTDDEGTGEFQPLH